MRSGSPLQVGSDDIAAVSGFGVAMLIGIVVAISAGVVVMTFQFKDSVGHDPPSIGLTTDRDASSTRAWDVRVSSAQTFVDPGGFLVVLDTPQTGTLVGSPGRCSGTSDRPGAAGTRGPQKPMAPRGADPRP